MTTATHIPDGVRQVIEQALQLRQASPEGKEIRFLAPCHDDRDPSARWNPDKHTWFCDVCKKGGGYKDLAEQLGLSLPIAGNGNGQPTRRIVKTYDYHDEHHALLYQVVRYEPKAFRQRRPNGKGGFTWDLNGVRPVVYQLPKLSGQARVYKPEGEKDVDRLWSLGLPATCNSGGAGKWTEAHAQQVKAAGVQEVILLPDNDEAGRKHVQAEAQCCFKAGLAVKMLELPNLPPKGDVSNWFDAGGTKNELNALADTASYWVPETHETHTAEDEPEQALRLTDVGNGELFARLHREHIRYCYGLKQWFIWDERRWKPDDGGGMTTLAKQTALSLYARAAHEPDEHYRKALAKWAAESETERRLTSMVSLARSEPGIAITEHQLDTDLLLLNVENGTLDLRTGVLRPARREDFITKMAPVAYRPDATCPIFNGMLNRLFATVPAIRAYLQRIFGYALTGLTIEQCFFIFHGLGANGKSTLLNTILDLLGEYADASRPETFMIKRHDGSIPNDVAALTGVRYVVTLESEKGQHLAEGLVKGLTGSDKVKARFLYKEAFRFTPQFKLFIGTNNKPVIVGTDLGIWRRVRCVPFAETISEAEKDRQLPARLLTEGSGILNWLVQGCLAWQQDGLGEPLEILEATAAYRAEQDVLGVFLKERCVFEPDARSTKKELYATYVAWFDESGEQKKHRLTMREFGKVLRDRRVVDIKVGNDKGWAGLRLRTAADVEPDDDAPVPTHQEVFADES